MHLTPIRVGALAVALVACGQVTGLSDDYEFDLVDGGSSATPDGGADATKADGSADGATDAAADASKQCTPAQALKTAQKLSSINGSQACKTCLATGCCMDVDTCTNNTDCSHVLDCKLDCTTKQGNQRFECFKGCTVSGTTPPLYTNGVGACATASCKQECGLQ